MASPQPPSHVRRLAARSVLAGTALALATLAGVALAPTAAFAQRKPVLAQIDVPHNYYFREMYLPQVTDGPNAVAWSPDGKELVFAMQGSLWRQRLDATRAVQLTAGPGYDLQPDWSRDGRRIVFVRYLGDAMELAQLDLPSGAVSMLTSNGGVNVDPRISPDGQRIAWVSTEGTGRFHIRVGEVAGGRLTSSRFAPERRSRTPRYYYSAVDHELSPSWSPNGNELVYVANTEAPYGTGGVWRRALAPDAEPVAVRIEETTWRARPDWSPDGRRIAYSSYAGRQWHQLWLAPARPGDPLPLTYGEFDLTGARWSPDGTRLAVISNRDGSPAIEIIEVIGGRRSTLAITQREYLAPQGAIALRITDSTGKPVSARVAVIGAEGRAHGPDSAWLHADDAFDRRVSSFEPHYFHTSGETRVRVPAGGATITVWRGLEHEIERRTIAVVADREQVVTIAPTPLALPDGWRDRWVSGDVHVHMNYGGAYRNTPANLVAQAAGEDLDVVFNLIVNKEQRIPDIAYFSTAPDPASTAGVLLSHGQEYHTSFWGHLGLLGLQSHFLMPDFAAYPHTAWASLYPTNAAIADLAHAQGALVGYVHPFDVVPDPDKDAVLTNALPVDAALGKVDYYEVVGFSDPKASAEVWHRLLNCGMRIAAAGGTDAMMNYASLRGPLGVNRTYVRDAAPGNTPIAPGDAAQASLREARWLAGLRAGRTLATNAPLIGFEVAGAGPGDEISAAAAREPLRYRGFLRSAVPIDHLELVLNGQVLRTIALEGKRQSADFEGTLPAGTSGWVLVRAWNDAAHPDIFDSYPYGTTNPLFIASASRAASCGADAEYFLRWIDRLELAASARGDYNTEAERAAALGEIRAAREVFEARR
jgi:hypothetical protein